MENNSLFCVSQTFKNTGNTHDSVVAEDILSHINLDGTIVMADKAYGKYALRKYIANHNTDFCIPQKSNKIDSWYCGWVQYKERPLVECFFDGLKAFRHITTRFDKLAFRFLIFIHRDVFAFSLYDYSRSYF